MKELQIRKEIYSAQSVLDAVAAYSGYARISVIEEADLSDKISSFFIC